MTTTERRLLWLPLNDLTGGEAVLDQPFPSRAAGDLTELTSSVRIHGVLSPILLREAEGGRQIICGYRRWLAARAAGLDRLPAQIAPLSDAEAIRCYLSENLLRRPLSEASQTEALTQLEELRDGTAAPRQAPSPPVPGREPLRAATVARAPTSWSPGSRWTAAAETEDGPTRAALRVRAFFEEVRSTRQINVPRTEILVDTILELHQGGSLAAACLAPVPSVSALDPVADHSLLTTLLAAGLGPLLSWDEESCRHLILGTFLHDVGMVFVIEGGWREARPLHQAERHELESHARIGHALVAGTREWPDEVAAHARDHHERWNGSGYPRGIRGTEVPLSCRLLGIIDAFAAMVSPRPHRDAMTAAHAGSRILRAMELGVFDPSLSFVLEGLVAAVAGEPESPPASVPTSPGVRNSVELAGALTTMRASEST